MLKGTSNLNKTVKTFNLTNKEQLNCPTTISIDAGRPTFWLNPVDRYHLEIADESHLKLKIALYYLCMAKPMKHLRELPVHEAEYDMIEKGMAQKEREDRELKRLLAAKEIKNAKVKDRANKRQTKAEDKSKSPGKFSKHVIKAESKFLLFVGLRKKSTFKSTSRLEGASSPSNRQEGSNLNKNIKMKPLYSEAKLKDEIKKHASVATLPPVDSKLMGDKKGPKEWWEKYNFSNIVLFRFKMDLSNLERSLKSTKKRGQTPKPEIKDLYVNQALTSFTSLRQWEPWSKFCSQTTPTRSTCCTLVYLPKTLTSTEFLLASL